MGKMTPHEVYEDLQPSLTNLQDLVRISPVEGDDKVMLATMVASYFIGTAIAAMHAENPEVFAGEAPSQTCDTLMGMVKAGMEAREKEELQ